MTARDQNTGAQLLYDKMRAEAVWWWRLKRDSRTEYRELLFGAYADFAKGLARRHAWRAHERSAIGDAQHWAYEGLLKAIDLFDLLRGVPFEAYARPRIAGSVRDGMARLGELDAQYNQRRRLERERLASLREGGDNDGDPIAEIGRLAAGLAVGMMLEGTRLIAVAAEPDPEPSPYDSLAWRQLQARLGQQIDRLPGGEARVIRLHYGEGLSFAQIADLLELSRGRISQLHRAALEHLRKRLPRED